MTKTIMLVHGAWLNGVSWGPWKARYESRGYKVVAPSWPYDDRTPEELRNAPDPALAKVGQRECLAHYEAEIKKLSETPFLIGHSLGGVYVQHLVDRGYGAAGVAINPAPTPGVALGPQAIISTLPVFSDPFSGGKVMHMSRKFFATRFAQTVPAAKSDEQYDRYIVPTPGKVWWNGVINAIPIDWKNPKRAPLLLIAGGKDLIADASMTKAIYNKQKQAPSLTEFKLYPDRSHWTCMDPGWEEVADFALAWVEKNGRR